MTLKWKADLEEYCNEGNIDLKIEYKKAFHTWEVSVIGFRSIEGKFLDLICMEMLYDMKKEAMFKILEIKK